MFRSKTRDLIIPQMEHSRLAGTIAALWGNDNFDKPAFDFVSFVAGVTLHDHGHGYFDMDDIGAMSPEEELDSMRRLVDHHLDDPIVETVANFHILRLLHLDNVWHQLIEECEHQIAAGITETQISRERYEWANRITWLCDLASFGFCFEEPMQAEVEVSPRTDQGDTVLVGYRIEREGKVVIDPWPLRVDRYEGFILGYEAAGYPDKLKPVMVHYILSN
jgi:hypothetical protein